MANEMRLQKYLSECGVASRRKSEELIAQNRVKVNGRIAKIGDKINPKRDEVEVAGKRVRPTAEPCYIMLHKPRGFVTTMSDELGRKCVTDLTKDLGTRVYPVGRLDRESEGLLLLTNDGAFANAMMHPARHISKTYRVTVRPTVTDDQISRLTTGLMIDGRKTAPAEVKILTREEGRVVLQMTIYEGRNRQIRKMCEALSLEVARLKRTAIGPVKLGMLPQGKWRHLNAQEVDKLLRSASKAQPQERS